MNLMIKIVLLTMCISAALVADSNVSTIIVTSADKHGTIEMAQKDVQKTLPAIESRIVRMQNRFLLEIGPFADSDRLTLAYLQIRKNFPEAFIKLPESRTAKEKIPVKIVTKPVYIEKPIYIAKEDKTLWIALFGLAIIGIFALFLSSDQVRHMKKKYDEMLKRQDEIEEKQSFLVEKMGEQIQEVTIKNIEQENKLLDINLKQTDPEVIKTHIETIREQDEDLLQTTYEMIDFLKIKSGNIVIKEEPFQLSNMLHMLTNAVSPLLRIETRTLQYAIDPKMSRYIVGDSVRIYQVLCNLLAHTLESTLDAKVRLSVTAEDEKELLFKISNPRQYIDKEEIERLFIPSSWEELQESNKQYSFYVTNELVKRMKGTLLISSHKKEGTTYQLKLPYIKDAKQQSHREALSKILKGKKALLIDQSAENAKILQEIMEIFGMQVQFIPSSKFYQTKPEVDQVELVFLRPRDISPFNLHFFKAMHENKRLKIVLVHDIFPEEDLGFLLSEVADAELFRPVIIGDVEEVLNRLYLQKNHTPHVLNHDEQNVKAFCIQNGKNVTQEAFRDFAGKSVLVVEDNEVNLKALAGILESGGIEVYKAYNGRQALTLLGRGAKVDLILMDINMPVMDGFEATKKIKDEPLFRKTPVVAVSGLGFYHELERMQFVGVDACIVKPYKLGQLYEALSRYLDIRDTTMASSHPPRETYEPPTQILDIQRGIRHTHHENFYREILRDVKEMLKGSDTYIADLIHQGKFDALQAFCRDSLSVVDTIGAKQLTKIFKEIIVFISMGEKESLEAYIPIYAQAWKLLDRELSLYLQV